MNGQLDSKIFRGLEAFLQFVRLTIEAIPSDIMNLYLWIFGIALVVTILAFVLRSL